jgi:UDP-N-acetylmuramate dehydrogenase
VPGTLFKSKCRAKIPEHGGFFVLNESPSFKQHLRSLRREGEPEIHERVDLRAWTALGVGGLADLLVRCRSVHGLQRVLDLFAAYGRQWLVLGAGSRLVPPNEGLRIPIINLTGNLALWELDLDGAVAGGGANLAQVSHAAARTGLEDLGRLMSAGNSIGGAVHAHSVGQRSLHGLLDWVDVARPGSGVERIEVGRRLTVEQPVDLDLERRVVVQVRLQLSDRLGGGTVAQPNQARRRLPRQPRSTAPAFLSPDSKTVEELLLLSDCTGLTSGGVRLSKNDPNRLCTARSSRSGEVQHLVRTVLQRVRDRTGVELRPALCFVDEEGRALDL